MELAAADIQWRQGMPYSLDYEDFYWSLPNGLAESFYVFLQQNDLPSRWNNLKAADRSFSIGELGFGTGINFLNCCELWLKTAPTNCTLYYFSAEPVPLKTADLAKVFEQFPSLSAHGQALIDSYPPAVKGFHSIELYEGRINLCLMLGDAQEMFNALGESVDQRYSVYDKKPIDTWFLNGFSPEKNPAMWQKELCKTIASLSSTETSLTTYLTESEVTKSLNIAGFSVNYKQGFADKYQMISATLNASLKNYSANARGTNQWHLNQLPSRPLSRQPSVTIIGAGIAGCTTAAALSKRGYNVTIIDRHARAGQEASGNQQAIIYPKLSIRDEPLPRINLAAITLASRYYQTFWNRGLGQQCGVLVIPEGECQRKQFEQLGQNFYHQKSLVRLLMVKILTKLLLSIIHIRSCRRIESCSSRELLILHNDNTR